MRTFPVWCLSFLIWGLTSAAWADHGPPGISTTDGTVYHVKMKTYFGVPNDNRVIDELRVWHALPTRRSWSQVNTKWGASQIKWSSTSGKQQYEADHDSWHIFWDANYKLNPGARYVFTTEFTVRSVTRNFDPKAVKVDWKAYARPQPDKEAKADAELARKVDPRLVKIADKFKGSSSPPAAVLEFCKWIKETLRYDAAVAFAPSDVATTLTKRCGHCGHYFAVLEQLCARAGIPIRRAAGLNLYAPDGHTGGLDNVRSDYTNIHTWAEVYFPGVGWIEVEPNGGDKGFLIDVRFIQNNKWFQNYSIWVRENGNQKQPTWSLKNGKYVSDYGVEHVITYTEKKETAKSSRK